MRYRVKFLCTVFGVPTESGEESFEKGEEVLVDETSFLILKAWSMVQIAHGMSPWIVHLDGDVS